jgi:hypothetical protein
VYVLTASRTLLVVRVAVAAQLGEGASPVPAACAPSTRRNVAVTWGGLGWITCLRAPAIAKLARDDGPLQLPLFDQHDLGEITHPDYSGERLIACRNRALDSERARKRDELLAATETLLVPITAAVAQGRLAGADMIGSRSATDRSLQDGQALTRCDQRHLPDHRPPRRPDRRGGRAGYVIRTSVPAEELNAPATVKAYKNLSRVVGDFRSLKYDDLDTRPTHHCLSDRVHTRPVTCCAAPAHAGRLPGSRAHPADCVHHPAGPAARPARDRGWGSAGVHRADSTGAPTRVNQLKDLLIRQTYHSVHLRRPPCILVDPHKSRGYRRVAVAYVSDTPLKRRLLNNAYGCGAAQEIRSVIRR